MSRLQLSPTQISAFAGKVGSLRAIDLKTAIAMVLQEFSADLDPFTRKDLTAVLREAGFPNDLEKDPEAWATVSAEIKRCASNTTDRGFYTQKGSIPSRAATPSRSAPPKPASTEAPSTSASSPDVEVQESEGVPWSPLLFGTCDETYSKDTGLRRIAISQSTCFGSYSSRAEACRECPLSSFCAQASFAGLPAIASYLDKATENSIKEALAPKKGGVPSPIDELLGIAPKPAATPDPDAGISLTGFPPGTSIIPTSFDAICSECSGEIQENSKGVHIPSRGLFHLWCAKP